MRGPLVDLWQSRPPRERRILAWGAGLLVLLLAYALVVDPLLVAGRRAEERLPELRRQVQQMRAMGAEVRQLQGRGPTRPGTPASPASLAASAQMRGVQVQATALGSGRWSVRAQAGQSAALLAWLDQVRREQGLAVSEASLATGTSGLTAELVLAP